MVKLGSRAYDLMYRFGAPWEGADRVELRALVRDGTCSAETLRPAEGVAARAIDLGCGAGGVACELAESGFTVTGVDFSETALRKARTLAAGKGLGPDRVNFVRANLTSDAIEGVPGPFDLLVDYGRPEDLPRFSFNGPSRAFPGLQPDEAESLFGPAFDIRQLRIPTRRSPITTYLLERRGQAGSDSVTGDPG